MAETVKIVDLNALKLYDKLLKEYINNKIVYATETEVLGLFETVTKDPAPVDATEKQFLENLKKNFKNGLKKIFNPFFNSFYK